MSDCLALARCSRGQIAIRGGISSSNSSAARRNRGARGWSRRTEEGSTALETVVLGAVVLLPLAMAIAAMATVQRAAIGVAAAAREGARLGVSLEETGHGIDAADGATRAVLASYGLDPGRARVKVSITGGTRKRVDVTVYYRAAIATLSGIQLPLPLEVTSSASFVTSPHAPRQSQ